MITVDSDIPLPRLSKDQGLTRALRNLAEGESIFLPGRDATYASRHFHRLRKSRPGKLYTSRTMAGGVRIWCVSDGPAREVTTADLLK